MPPILRQMRWQIAVAYTLMVVLILGCLASVLYTLNRSTYLRTLEAGIVGQAYLVASLAESIPPGADSAPLDALVDRVGQKLNARVTLISPDGQMLADSLLPREEYADRSDRPEVMAALRYGLGETQRHSTTTGDDRFYVAVPFERDGALVGVVRVGVPLTTITTAQTGMALAVLATALLAATISFGLAVLIARRTTRPLLELRGMAERLAGGDLGVQAPIPAGEEVGALAQSFNQMASQLRQLVEAQARERERLTAILATMHDGILILDSDNHVTLANRATAELLATAMPTPFAIGEHPAGPAILDAARAARATRSGSPTLIDELTPEPGGRSLRAIVTRLGEHGAPQTLVMLQDLTELRRAEGSRRMLLANITHDLRTPLASLQALLDALVGGAVADPEVASDFLCRMEIEVLGLSRLVDEFLELSRLELGQVTLRRSRTDFGELLRAVAGRMQAQAQQKSVTIGLEVAEPLPPVNIDPDRIEQVLLNLLQNALTYTPAGGRVAIGAWGRDGEVLTAVKDTGVGIEPGDLCYIFDRFYKADPSRSSAGVGLGLAISKHLVEQHGGRIWAESAPAHGTTISFTLPAETAPL
jgi:two-component system phosphate regulon sensor histidine kinase PhoR